MALRGAFHFDVAHHDNRTIRDDFVHPLEQRQFVDEPAFELEKEDGGPGVACARQASAWRDSRTSQLFSRASSITWAASQPSAS